MKVYLDTSAAVKLMIEEAESTALARYLDADGVTVASSVLLETELRRTAERLDVPQSRAVAVLDRVALAEAPRSLFAEAGLLPGVMLRSLDAIHLATALRLESDVVVSYDIRQIAAAEGLGQRVESPGGWSATALPPPYEKLS